MNIEELRATFLFETFSDEQLEWLTTHAEEMQLEGGTELFTQSQAPDALWVLLEGEIQFYRVMNGRVIELETSVQPGNWGGWLPMFDNAPMTISARVPKTSRLLRIPRESVRYMLAHGFPVTTHLLMGMFYGVQNFEATTRQQEKMAALGKLSAGLAHELNNPASAARQASRQMRAAVYTLHEREMQLCDYDFSPDHLTVTAQLQDQVRARMVLAKPLDPLARSDREDSIATWLDEHGVGEGWNIAPTLVSAGIDVDWLETLATELPGGSLGAVVAWLDADLTVSGLINEIEHSTERISDLVKAIKAYSYMDQAEVQELDIHAGLDNTLTMLNHKLKHGIEIRRNYDRTLPHITAYGGELNQVWTNLIDNAIDAMDNKGTLTITTGRDETCVLVEIADTGPGVPKEIQTRIFEPFFTTKPQGKGTGLGLDVAYRIIANRHHGNIKLISQPGDTRFQIWIPINQQG